MLYELFKKLAFNFDPELIHHKSINIFERFPAVSTLFKGATPGEKYTLSDGHMSWRFPIGLAAGLDKNAQALTFFQKLGFGAVEVGTITPKAQSGNPKPRIWRLAHEQSLLNSMGFPGSGVLAAKDNVTQFISHNHQKIIIGSNLGKNKKTPLEKTPEDYAHLYEVMAPVSDYLVINISSPNTPGLRGLQNKSDFKAICLALDSFRKQTPRPLYLKISPGLDQEKIFDLVDLCKEFSFSGVIATNTSAHHDYSQGGGLSGKLLKKAAAKTRKDILLALKEVPSMSVIGVGGIDSFEEVVDFWQMGGKFVQIYTSFIYQGPSILSYFQKCIDEKLLQHGHESLQEWHKHMSERH